MAYFTTKGRLNRWSYFLQILVPALFGGVGSTMMDPSQPETFSVGFVIVILSGLVAVFPAVRRLHDLNASGWWYILSIVPIANFVLGLVLLFQKGTEGGNCYGPDPVQSNAAQGEDKSTRRSSKERISPNRAEEGAQGAGAQEFDPDEHEKKCPMCAEYIKLEARRCKHCGYEVSVEEVERQIEERRQEVEKRSEKMKEESSEGNPESSETPPPGKAAARCGACHHPLWGDEKQCPNCQREVTWS